MDKIKLCKDCEHRKKGVIGVFAVLFFISHWFWVCRNALEVSTCPVSGKRVIKKRDCCLERAYGECGPEGKCFTPRKSLWQRVKGWFE